MGFLEIVGSLWMGSRPKAQNPFQQTLELLKRDPENPRGHLKLAEIYQKNGKKSKAISEYLLAAEIFAKNNLYVEAMAIYKQVPKQDPSLDHVYLKIADIYRKMGFLGDAFAQYRILVNHYDSLGMKEKALEVMGMMAEMDPRKITREEKDQNFKDIMKLQEGEATNGIDIHEGSYAEAEQKITFFDLSAELDKAEPVELKDFKEISSLEKVYGVEEIFNELKETSGPSLAFPDFNYHMGVACKEMGFFDEAVNQFKIAMDQGQNPFEAANQLGLCFKEKKMLEEACQAFEKALQVKGVSQKKTLEVKYELGLINRELGRSEEALKLLREIAEMDQEGLTIKNGVGKKAGIFENLPKTKKK